MNRWFTEFIHDAKQRADSTGIRWELRLGPDGKVAKEQRWDLSAMVRSPPRARCSAISERTRAASSRSTTAGRRPDCGPLLAAHSAEAGEGSSRPPSSTSSWFAGTRRTASPRTSSRR